MNPNNNEPTCSGCTTCDSCGKTAWSLTWVPKGKGNLGETTYTRMCPECFRSSFNSEYDTLLDEFREFLRQKKAKGLPQPYDVTPGWLPSKKVGEFFPFPHDPSPGWPYPGIAPNDAFPPWPPPNRGPEYSWNHKDDGGFTIC